jgi:hypothetical protein
MFSKDLIEDKTVLLSQIHQERQRLEATLATLSVEQMLQPGVHDHWSVKDDLAHIVAWEGNMVRWVERALTGQVPQMLPPGLTWEDIDQWNEQIYQEHRDLPLDEMLYSFQTSYRQALATAEALSEQDLMDPERFAWREGRALFELVAANTCWHYREHNEAILAWLEQG